MPRWVGGLRYEEDRPLEEAPAEAKVVRLAYNQAEKVRDHGGQVYYVLDRTDLGGPRRLARRWYRWYARARQRLAIHFYRAGGPGARKSPAAPGLGQTGVVRGRIP
jgi:hypothetical protein